MHRTCRFLFALVSILNLGSAGYAGWVFTTVTRGENDKGSDPVHMTVKASVEDERGRVEFTESQSPQMKPGSYLLTQDGGKTLYMVSPEDKSYMKWDVQSMLAGAGQAMQAMKGVMNMNCSDPTVEKLLDEKGEPILGYPTRHYQFRTTYTTEVSFLGMKSSSGIVTDEELWTTHKLTDAACGIWLRRDPPKTGNAQIDALITNRMSAIEGFPLKRLTKTTTTDKKGKTHVGQTSMEVTSIKKQSLPDETFALPADYTETVIPVVPTEVAAPEGDAPTNAPPMENPFLKLIKRRLPR
jgi:hypothetical protein